MLVNLLQLSHLIASWKVKQYHDYLIQLIFNIEKYVSIYNSNMPDILDKILKWLCFFQFSLSN